MTVHPYSLSDIPFASFAFDATGQSWAIPFSPNRGCLAHLCIDFSLPLAMSTELHMMRNQKIGLFEPLSPLCHHSPSWLNLFFLCLTVKFNFLENILVFVIDFTSPSNSKNTTLKLINLPCLRE